MFTAIILLTGLMSANNPPVGQPNREVIVDFRGGASFVFALPEPAGQDYRVAIGTGIRVDVPALGPARPADRREQVFSFYVGLFR